VTWNLVWSDDFDSATIDTTKWTKWVGGWSPDWLLAANVTVTGSVMTITAKDEDYSILHYTSGLIYSQHKGYWKYGKIEIRAKMPYAPNLVPAFWIKPEITPTGTFTWDAACEYGEIDITEIFTTHSNTTIKGTCIYGIPTIDQGIWYDTGVVYSNDYHTYGIEWKLGEIRWTFDGIVYHTVTSWYSSAGAYPHPFDDPFFLIIGLQVGSTPPPTTIFPIYLEVDWVKVYEWKNCTPMIFTVGVSEIGCGIIERDIYNHMGTPAPKEIHCDYCPCTPDAWMWCTTAYLKMIKARYPIPY
jgi:beta-glucanase (GH16 family)